MNSRFLEPSLVDIDEVALVRRLLEDRHRRSNLLAIRGMPRHALSKECVRLDELPGSPKGDVDILLWASEEPQRAVAIEVKRFKATVGDPSETRLNKLREFEKGVRQANALARIGFSQAYLWVFVLVDSRRRNNGRITYDGLTPALSKLIEETVTTRGLDARVGLIHHEFVQPMDQQPLDVGLFGGHLIRLASEEPQPAGVTAWVERMSHMPNKPLEPTPKDGAAHRRRYG